MDILKTVLDPIFSEVGIISLIHEYSKQPRIEIRTVNKSFKYEEIVHKFENSNITSDWRNGDTPEILFVVIKGCMFNDIDCVNETYFERIITDDPFKLEDGYYLSRYEQVIMKITNGVPLFYWGGMNDGIYDKITMPGTTYKFSKEEFVYEGGAGLFKLKPIAYCFFNLV